jgi:stage V sporulation protein SpoVS
MPQTYSQKYSEELGCSSSNFVYDDRISWYVDKHLPFPRLPHSLQPHENLIETVEEGRYDEPKGKGEKGKPTRKGGRGFNATSEAPYSASAYSESTSETRYSASAYSESSGARERGATVRESYGDTWEDVTEDLDYDEARLSPFKVSSTSDVRIVAGAIANAARRGARGLVISACGAASINQAVKSIAVARGAYLKDDNIEIYVCGINLADEREFKHLVYIDIRFVRSRKLPSLGDTSTHKVSGSSLAGKVAGAIASSLRDGVCCQVSVVGADAMLKAVLAISICASYMDVDPHPLSLVLWPDFDTIYVDGERRTGLSFYIIATSKRRTY